MDQTKFYIDANITAVRELHRHTLALDRSEIGIADFLAQQVDNIVAAHAAGNTAVVFHLTCWCPELIGQSAETIMATRVTEAQVQASIAREHGYSDWGSVPAGTTFDIEFEQAVDHMLSGQLDSLQTTLKHKPQLVAQTSPFGHRAGLLHYLAANGVESHRQITPYNALAIVQCLIDNGVDCDAVANIYGGSTALELWQTSAHPASAGVQQEVTQELKIAMQN